jgi:hypothetical protein
MPTANGQPPRVDPSGVALATLMAEHTPLLASILAELRSGTIEVGVGDAQFREMVLDQFPVAGSKRILANRTGNGSDSIAVATGTAAAPINGLVIPANEARMGGRIVNTGTNPVILYLTDRPVPVPGVPAIYLNAAAATAAAGNAWDFRLGTLLWCGNVSAVGQGGASTLTLAVV